MKCTVYSHDSIVNMMSFNTPSSSTIEVYVSCSTMVVIPSEGCKFKVVIVSIVITLISTPRSIRVFCIRFWLIQTLTIGLPGSKRLGLTIFHNINSTSFPTTLNCSRISLSSSISFDTGFFDELITYGYFPYDFDKSNS